MSNKKSVKKKMLLLNNPQMVSSLNLFGIMLFIMFWTTFIPTKGQIMSHQSLWRQSAPGHPYRQIIFSSEFFTIQRKWLRGHDEAE